MTNTNWPLLSPYYVCIYFSRLCSCCLLLSDAARCFAFTTEHFWLHLAAAARRRDGEKQRAPERRTKGPPDTGGAHGGAGSEARRQERPPASDANDHGGRHERAHRGGKRSKQQPFPHAGLQRTGSPRPRRRQSPMRLPPIIDSRSGLFSRQLRTSGDDRALVRNVNGWERREQA